MSRINETRFLVQHESCESNPANPSTCHCECNKVFKFDEYLKMKNCSCENVCEDEKLSTTETEKIISYFPE